MSCKECNETVRCKECQGDCCPYGTNFISNQDMARKLLERTTFRGIIISSTDDPHSDELKNFAVSYNSQLDKKAVATMLVLAAEALMKEQ